MKKTILLLIAAVFIQLAGCGPSQAELNAAAQQAVAAQVAATQAAATQTAIQDSMMHDPSIVKIEKITDIVKPDGVNGTLRIMTIDGHDYITWISDQGGVSMCHDQNCTNPSQR